MPKKYNLIIMAGGSGERLWPLSTSNNPKQFIKLGSSQSLFQKTYNRFLSDIDNIEKISIITNEKHRLILHNQLKELTSDFTKINIILEPEAKNTAPSMTLGILSCENVNSPCVTVPADHIYDNDKLFIESIHQSLELSDNEMCILAAKPSAPSEHYGHIQTSIKNNIKYVEKFIEKPTLAKSKKLISNGCYWNVGIFIIYPDNWNKLFSKYDLNSFNLCKKSYENIHHDGYFSRVDKNYFSLINSNSIDYAVIENIDVTKEKIIVQTINTNWNDLGSWETFSEYFFSKSENNAFYGKVFSHSTKNSIIYSKKKVLTSNLDSLMVIDTDNSLCISDRSSSSNIKDVLNLIPDKIKESLNKSSREDRIWGYYEVLHEEDNYKVKKLVLYPGMKISLQKHKYRSEHWVVLSGVATVVQNTSKIKLEKNQSTYIEQGNLHQLINETDSLLEIIEVQIGSYLGEDDIERIDEK